MNDKDRSKHFKTLGEGKTRYQYDRPDPSVLEWFRSPFPQNNNVMGGYGKGKVRIKVPEFTSLCPKTGAPDFATIVIEYCPNGRCVESKSLKLYLMGFRNFGEFHESCVARIAQDLICLLDPEWLKVEGQFTPRGGIPFWPSFTYHKGISIR